MSQARRGPMLEILQAYVLDCIGQLDATREEDIKPVVRRAFGGGDWRATIRRAFSAGPELDGAIREMWSQAQSQQAGLDAEEFARLVVAENFAEALDARG